MNNLEKIKRQLSKPVLIKIKNSDGQEDDFYFKKLNVGQQAIMMELSKKFNSRDMITIDGKEVPDVSKEEMMEMENLLFDIVKNSMPEIDDNDILSQFVNDNFDQLSEALVKLIPKEQDSDKKKLINERMESMKNGK